MEWIQYLVELFFYLVDLFLHLDQHLNALVVTLGPWLYLLLFVVVFCETGLVVTPILPGDSLLFAVGALAAVEGSPLNIHLLGILLLIAAIFGDFVNYKIGYHVGPKIFAREDVRFLDSKHLDRSRQFYEKYGGKTIVLARFIPIIRTFAPFVAGIGKMEYRRFAIFNIGGAMLWILSFLVGGFFMGNVPTVKQNFHIIIVCIIVISVMPAVVEVLLAWRTGKRRSA